MRGGLTLLGNHFGSASYLSLPFFRMTAGLPFCFLFDNGSLRPESTLALRRSALALSVCTGATVRPVSLLHSSRVAQEDLNGEPAELLEPALTEYLGSRPTGRVILIPLFFGPSTSLTVYLSERLHSLRNRFPQAEVVLTPWLAADDFGEQRIVAALDAQVTRTIVQYGLERPRVVLVDHGSPQPEVVTVRDTLARRLAESLANRVAEVAPASMERRPGDAYAFGDPLLAVRLTTAPFDTGDVVVALQFLAAGRHAGPAGDVAGICAEAAAQRPGLRIWLTAPIGETPEILEVLARRYAQAAGHGVEVS